jgi:outer membrane receptor protein involved in Fe transport
MNYLLLLSQELNYMVKRYFFIIFLNLCLVPLSFAQISLEGVVRSAIDGELLFGASVLEQGTTNGVITDFDGNFKIEVAVLPTVLVISYVGFEEQTIPINTGNENLKIDLEEAGITLESVQVKGYRISDKQKTSALTVEALDLLAIKETPSDNFYDGLGSLKGVDLTAASLGFKVINMRGFNSTSPVRSLQIIDGVDNQAPGLNFSLGNFLGASELDVQKVELVVGASSAFYGPNAFNGVISMETKNPFYFKGLAGSVKAGERNMFEVAVRYADAFKNKKGEDVVAFKLNFFRLTALDWTADNYDPVTGTLSGVDNPGGWDAVNIYGDESNPAMNFTDPSNLSVATAGLGRFHRSGYREIDLVDYNTRNTKAGAAIHWRTNPGSTNSPELIYAVNFGAGTTVYQGDNRFSLRNITFLQNRLEFQKKDKYFLRFYSTHEDAGDSYDPYFTALRLQDSAKTDNVWSQDYTRYWQQQGIVGQMQENGYPKPFIDFTQNPPQLVFDSDSAMLWIANNPELLAMWHAQAAAFANQASPVFQGTRDFYEPGTQRFFDFFNQLTSRKSTEGGTRFFDKSALYHLHGEYNFEVEHLDRLVVGANGRLYTPNSEGTIFKDTAGTTITNYEYGVYVGGEKRLDEDKWILNATVRMDKNENFGYLFSPAASVVWNPIINNYLRLSFSSAIRNPTLSDQFLNLNVGRATLLGNLDGFDSLITIESFRSYASSLNQNNLEFFDVAPVTPEKVRTWEVGYRTTLFDNTYLDLSYYYSYYRDFLGFKFGIDTEFDEATGFPINTNAYRIAANADKVVTTQGVSAGINYYFRNYYMLNGNYSWNRLNSDRDEDRIIPAFNTPEHKFNIGFSGRAIPLNKGINRILFGFNVNYKWIEGFIFEGSPQFTGSIPTYDLMDAQINFLYPRINTTLKIGASNVLDKRQFQTYGGPRIGRLAYISLVYDWQNKG